MNLSALNLITLILATWWLAYVITNKGLPFGVMTFIRSKTTPGGLLTCICCVAVWAAALCYWLLTTPFAPLVTIAGAAGGALLLHRFTGGDHL